MCEQDAPACAYLKAVPNCHLRFVNEPEKELGGGKGRCKKRSKWFSCSYCRTKNVPGDMHAGHVFDSDITDIKPVVEWDMQKPQPVAALRNRYEIGQVSLAGLFSTTVKDAGFSQWKHVQGEVNAIHKLDRHYYGLFGFLACKEESIASSSSHPRSSLSIHRALRWFKSNNHLYSSFFANYETLFRYAKPSFVNPKLLERQDIPMDQLLEDEVIGMAFPVDGRYLISFH